MSSKLSFVIPSYNCATWLAHAVESCQKQSYADIEIVVVDDASTDSTQKLMSFLREKDKRIKYMRNPTNLGRSASRNFGNKMASGDFIAVLDADDIAYPDRARLTVDKLKKVDFVCGSCDYIDAVGNKLGTHIADVFNLDRALKEGMNRMVHSTCAYRKDLALKIPYRSGEFAELGLDDWAFQLEVALFGAKIDHIAPVIGAYRELQTAISKTRDREKVIALKKGFTEGIKVPA